MGHDQSVLTSECDATLTSSHPIKPAAASALFVCDDSDSPTPPLKKLTTFSAGPRIRAMPYNNTPIAPPRDITGTVSLPLARVKRIIHADEDISACSNNAAFAIAVATEMFVQHLVEQTHNVVKSERRPRRNIQYRDVASAISRLDNLEFLTDVVPRTMTYKQFKEKKATKESQIKLGEQQASHLSNGQKTLDQMSHTQQRRGQGPQHADRDDEGGDDGDVEMDMGEQELRQQHRREGHGHSTDDDSTLVDANGQDTNGYSQARGGGVYVSVPPRAQVQQPRPRPPPARHAYDAVRDRFDE